MQLMLPMHVKIDHAYIHIHDSAFELRRRLITFFSLCTLIHPHLYFRGWLYHLLLSGHTKMGGLFIVGLDSTL